MKTRYRPALNEAGRRIPLTYEVDAKFHGEWTHLGRVQRFGSLPSMRGWCGLPVGGGEWTRKRQTRPQAADDLVNLKQNELGR
jgi:hypothetical protein